MRKAQSDAAAGRIESKVPLPPLSDRQAAAMLADMGARAAVGPAALPSCAFFTFVNTHQALNCAAFSPDASAVAGDLPTGC